MYFDYCTVTQKTEQQITEKFNSVPGSKASQFFARGVLKQGSRVSYIRVRIRVGVGQMSK